MILPVATVSTLIAEIFKTSTLTTAGRNNQKQFLLSVHHSTHSQMQLSSVKNYIGIQFYSKLTAEMGWLRKLAGISRRQTRK